MTEGLVILIMGVSGSGKTTLGRSLAERLSFQFADADDFHSPANKEKMQQGLPLTPDDRLPWLALTASKIALWLNQGEQVVLACSALEKSQRSTLVKNKARTPIVFLRGSFDLTQNRIAKRKGHFFNSQLLPTQFAILEEPEEAIVLDIKATPTQLIEQAYQQLKPYLKEA
jgi:gluconokinase